MLKSLKVENYESHALSEIEFHPGVNVIVGPSDSGKSALLRALYWALTTKVGGESFRSHWGGKTSVALEFEDGRLERIRDKGFNGYKFNGNDYKGFGKTLPEPVDRFINLNEINFQRQADPHFMMQWTAGKVGEFLNQITNLEVIDRTVAKIKRMILEEDRAVAKAEADIERIRQELKAYSDLAEQEEALEKLELEQESIDVMEKEVRSLSRLVRDAQRADEEYQECKTGSDGLEEVEILLSQIERDKRLLSKVRGLRVLVEGVQSAEELMQDYADRVEEAELKFHKLMPKECPLCGSEIDE